jgi:hypothetical protein
MEDGRLRRMESSLATDVWYVADSSSFAQYIYHSRVWRSANCKKIRILSRDGTVVLCARRRAARNTRVLQHGVVNNPEPDTVPKDPMHLL